MKLNVRHVDDATMKKDTPRKSLGFQVQRILKLIGRKEQDKLDEYLIQKFVEKQLKTILMELKEETGVEAESVVRRDEKQEKYYNTKLSELRSLAEKIGRV